VRKKSKKIGRSGLRVFRVALGRVRSRAGDSTFVLVTAGFHSRHEGDGEAREGVVDRVGS
jgi:hypothetical protein